MNLKKIIIYSLATTYPESSKSTKPHFVHILNKELVKFGASVLAISYHLKGSICNETLDSVEIRRFRYFPEKYELDAKSIPDELNKSKFGIAKVIIMIFVFFLFTFFTCLKRKPNIIHGQWAFPGGYIAYIIAKIFGVKSVITVHFAEIPLLKRFKFLQKTVVRGLNHSSQVVAVSNHTKNELVSMGVKKEKIIVIRATPNFVEHTSDTELLKEFRSKITSQDHKIILFLGRLVEHKGVNYLIKSIPEISTKNVHLIIAGKGIMEKEWKQLTKSLGLEKQITFFGSPSHEELGWLHGISDIFVCPSIIDARGNTEGLGLVIPEAMESGLPVIASAVGGIVDIIKNESNGLLVPQKDPTSIAKAIERIISDKKLEKKFIENSKETLKEFSTKIIAEKYFDLYKTLMNS